SARPRSGSRLRRPARRPCRRTRRTNPDRRARCTRPRSVRGRVPYPFAPRLGAACPRELQKMRRLPDAELDRLCSLRVAVNTPGSGPRREVDRCGSTDRVVTNWYAANRAAQIRYSSRTRMATEPLVSTTRMTRAERTNQRNAVLAGFLGWTLDAFDFF